MENKIVIAVETIVNAPIEKTWEYWIRPEHIIHWNNPSDDWHTTKAENNLVPGGSFLYRMEAKDGSFGFDFHGKYDQVKPLEYIEYTIADGRKVKIYFTKKKGQTVITESFEAENTHPVDMQQQGWQSILNNFKKYTEAI